jgi:large subunit ribosomal protein L19e
MNLNKKKELAARTLKVGKARILFNVERLDEVKEAITKQDIKDLHKDKAILIKEISGTKTKKKRKTRRRKGSIKQKVNTRKRDYMTITRKLRAYLSELKGYGRITNEDFWSLRKEIRAKKFKSKAQMKERIQQITKDRVEEKQ